MHGWPFPNIPCPHVHAAFVAQLHAISYSTSMSGPAAYAQLVVSITKESDIVEVTTIMAN